MRSVFPLTSSLLPAEAIEEEKRRKEEEEERIRQEEAQRRREEERKRIEALKPKPKYHSLFSPFDSLHRLSHGLFLLVIIPKAKACVGWSDTAIVKTVHSIIC